MLNRRSFIKKAGLVGLGTLLPAGPIGAAAMRSHSRIERSGCGPADEEPCSRNDPSALDDLLAIERWEDVRDEADCREVVRSYLPPSGRLKRWSPIASSWIGPCPFCHSGCFEVSRELYACTDCRASGSPVEFIAQAESLTRAEALQKLARMLDAGMLQGVRREYARFWRVMEDAANFYHSILLERPEGERGREWAKRQGLTEATIRQLRLGYCPSAPDTLLRDHLQEQGYSEDEMRVAGLIGHRIGQQRLIDRHANDVLLVPVHDGRGRVWSLLDEPVDWRPCQEVLWGAREGPLYSHRYDRLVYPSPGWPQDFRRHDQLFLTQHPLDVLLLRQQGLSHVVCPVGARSWDKRAVLRTACAMADHLIHVSVGPMDSLLLDDLLKVVAPYGDRVRFLTLPSGTSLGRLLQSEGSSRIAKLVASAQPITRLLMA